MHPSRRHFISSGLGLGLGTLLPPQVLAQSFPSKTVRIVVGFPPGGGADYAARTISIAFAKALGQQVYIENKAGANGSIGATSVVRADPDGHTILVSTSGAIVLNPTLIKPSPYDPVQDLAAVGRMLTNTTTFVANPSVPGKNMRELIEWSRAQNKPLVIASSGNGSIPHMAIELLAASAKIQVVHVPYRGAGPALTDVMGGQVQCFVADMPVVLSQINAGRVRAMGVASDARSPVLPELQTLAEQGFPGTTADNWYGMFAPAKTPKDVVQKLNAALLAALGDATVQSQLKASGVLATPSTPDELARLVQAEVPRWKKLIDDKRITLE